MEARMKNPAMLLPEATLQAIMALGKAAQSGAVPERTLELVHLRASQINGCSVCVDMHAQGAHQERRERRAPVRGGGVARVAATSPTPSARRSR